MSEMGLGCLKAILRAVSAEDHGARMAGCLRTVDRIAELIYGWCAQQMEDAMCYAKDYRFLDNQKKAEDTQVPQERRAGLIARLLNAANKQGEKTEAERTPAKEVAQAK